jgi:uncharacterized protein (UPF0332 family)
MNRETRREEMVRYWWRKARDSMASAKREYGAGAYSFAMNRLYYAAFYAVSAVLLDREQTFKKHSGVRAAFHRQFVRTGIVDLKWGQLYDQLFEDRQEGDYVEFVSFEPEYVAYQMERCSEFLDALRPLLPPVGD